LKKQLPRPVRRKVGESALPLVFALSQTKLAG
jgi:hypothetical protein